MGDVAFDPSQVLPRAGGGGGVDGGVGTTTGGNKKRPGVESTLPTPVVLDRVSSSSSGKAEMVAVPGGKQCGQRDSAEREVPVGGGVGEVGAAEGTPCSKEQ